MDVLRSLAGVSPVRTVLACVYTLLRRGDVALGSKGSKGGKGDTSVASAAAATSNATATADIEVDAATVGLYRLNPVEP
jgi:hypothetical protein